MVCEYCGSLTGPLVDPAQEWQALDEFHGIMLTKDRETRINLLNNGFLPKSAEGLIEAGVRCIPLIDLSQPSDKGVISAAGRLQAIVTKIKIMPEFEQKQSAITEFEKVLQARQVADRNLGLAVIAVGLVLVLCVMGTAGYFLL
jgi:hypothetical protein